MVRNAHSAAATYYSDRNDPVSIAEHVYHRLMLGQQPDPFVWDGTTTSLDMATHRYLATAMDEVPPQGKLFLASQLGLEISGQLRAAANDADSERIIGPRALQTLLHQGTQSALELLQERKARTAESPLLAIEARCYLSLKEYGKVDAYLQDALGNFPVTGNPGRQAELTWLLAQARLQAGRRAAGIETLVSLAAFAATLTNPVPRVQTLAVLIDLLPSNDGRRGPARDDLAGALAQCPEELFSSEADVIRYGFSRVSIEKSSKLTSVALMTLSTLYDIVVQKTGFALTSKIVAGIADLALSQQALAEKLSGGAGRTGDGRVESEAKMLGEFAVWTLAQLDSERPTISDILKLVSELRGALTRSLSPEAPLSMAACMSVWWLAQGITGSLIAATLGGLDPYREPWELMSDLEALA